MDDLDLDRVFCHFISVYLSYLIMHIWIWKKKMKKVTFQNISKIQLTYQVVVLKTEIVSLSKYLIKFKWFFWNPFWIFLIETQIKTLSKFFIQKILSDPGWTNQLKYFWNLNIGLHNMKRIEKRSMYSFY